MFARKIKSNKGIIQIGKFGIDKIDLNLETMHADIYTASGNIFQVKCKQISHDNKVVVNSKNHHKNLY